jgi:hypothetical protein
MGPARQVTEHEARAGQLLELNHVREGVEGWREMLHQQDMLENCACEVDDATKRRATEGWRAAVETTFNANAIFSHLQRAVSTQLTTTELEAVAAFYASDLGKEVLRLERPPKLNSRTPEQDAEAFIRQNQMLESDPVRKKVINELVESGDMLGKLVDVLSSISIGTSIGALAVWPEGQPRPTQEDIIEQVAEQREPMKEMIRPMLFGMMAEIYQSLNIADLRKYRAVQEEAVHKKFGNAMISGLREALEAQAIAIGAAFTKSFTAQRS